MKNTVIKRTLDPDNLCKSLFEYRLKVTSCGLVTAYTNEPTEESFTHLYRLCYFVEGNAVCYIDKKSYKIPPRTALYLPPNHRIEVIRNLNGSPSIFYFINFEIGNLARRNEFHEMIINSCPFLMVNDQNDVLMHQFEEVFNEASNEKVGACGFIQNLFHMIVTHMIRYSQTTGHNEKIIPSKFSGTTSLLNKATDYIYNHLHENIKINHLAKEVGISEIYLYKLFKEHTNRSPQQFLADYRIQVAKEFLSNPDYTIKMIADELGFCSANHFSTAFKKQLGMSPHAWRIQNKENTQ